MDLNNCLAEISPSMLSRPGFTFYDPFLGSTWTQPEDHQTPISPKERFFPQRNDAQSVKFFLTSRGVMSSDVKLLFFYPMTDPNGAGSTNANINRVY